MNILKTSRINQEKADYLLKMVSELEEVLNRLAGAAPLPDGKHPKEAPVSLPPAPGTVAEALYNTTNSLDKTNAHLERLINFLQNDVLPDVNASNALATGEGSLARVTYDEALRVASLKPAPSALREDAVSAVARELNPDRI